MLTSTELRCHLRHRRFFPGVRLTVHATPWSGGCLCVWAEVPSSYRPERVVLDIHSLIPPMATVEDFDRWMVWRLIEIASHEVREWYRDDQGRAIFDPHAADANLASHHEPPIG